MRFEPLAPAASIRQESSPGGFRCRSGRISARAATARRRQARVRIAKRSAAHVPAGCDVVLGDAADRRFCTEAASGATTVYHCLNPPYDARVWAELVPRYMDNLIAASAQTGAHLVVLDNLYMLGRPRGRPLNEDTPLNPSSRKGEIRALAAERLFEADRRAETLATSCRASDVYGPGGTQTGLGDFFWPRVLSGRTAYSPFPLDAIHTYTRKPGLWPHAASADCELAESELSARLLPEPRPARAPPHRVQHSDLHWDDGSTAFDATF